MAKVHLVLPAAGVGQRFGLNSPKQYCEINGKTVMEWTLSAFEGIDLIDKHLIALQPDDSLAAAILDRFPKFHVVSGGTERFISVRNALRELHKTASDQDWVFVHDVARPCIRLGDILKLANYCISTGNGAVLGRPITDTIKQRIEDNSWKTVDRSTLWSVQTPQCFQLGPLLSALNVCIENNVPITDEASAIEACGGAMQVIEGSADNIKLTYAEDAALIGHYLKQQERY